MRRRALLAGNSFTRAAVTGLALGLAVGAVAWARMRETSPPSVSAPAVMSAPGGETSDPQARSADERESRRIDALVAAGRIGDAHYRALLFVQHYPDSPFASHVAALMGVRPRPAGVVPEAPEEEEVGAR